MVNTDSSVYFTLEYETIYMRVSAEGALEILTEWGKSHLKAPWQTVHTVLMYLVLDSWTVSCDKNLSQPHNPIHALAPTHTSACSCTTYRSHDERMCGFHFMPKGCDREFPLRLEKKKLSNVCTFKSPRLSHAQMNTHAYPQSFCLIHTFTCTCTLAVL